MRPARGAPVDDVSAYKEWARPMADPKNEDPTTASGPPIADAGSGNGGVSVNWRGIVDDDAPQPKTVRFFNSCGARVVGILVALGLKRKRLPDGSLAPRPWVRVIVIWGGGLALFVLFSAGHVVGAGNVGVPVTLGDAGQPARLRAAFHGPVADHPRRPAVDSYAELHDGRHQR